MAQMPQVGARVLQDWQQQIQQIAQAAGLKEAEIVRSALAQYLGRTDSGSVKGAYALRVAAGIASLEDRVASLERKLAGLRRLVG